MIAVAKYRDLSIADKRAVAIAGVRERPVPCPGGCGMSLMPADLLAHVDERCTGPVDPGPVAKWLTHRDVLALGVPRETLSFWARNGHVRTRGDRGDREYLLRDLSLRIAERRLRRRR